MKRVNIIAVMFLMSLCSILTAKDDDKAIAYAGWQEFKNEKLKIKTKTPKNWLVKKQGENSIHILSEASIEKKDSLRIEITSLPAAEHESNQVVFTRYLDRLQKDLKGFSEQKKESGIFKTLHCVNLFFEFEEFQLKRKATLKYFRCNDKDYFYNFVARPDDAEKNLSFFTRALDASDPFVFQKFPLFHFTAPEGWSEYNEEGFAISASKSEDNRNFSEGTVKVFVRKVDKDLSLSNYTTQLISTVYAEDTKAPEIALTPTIQATGVQFQYFDLIDKDELIKERYLVYKYDQFVYVIYFVAKTELFEKYKFNEFTKALQSFSLVKE